MKSQGNYTQNKGLPKCAESRDNLKEKPKNRPSGMFRAALLYELRMTAEQFRAWIRSAASEIVRKLQTEAWKMQPGELLYTGNGQLYIQLAVCRENEQV